MNRRRFLGSALAAAGTAAVAPALTGCQTSKPISASNVGRDIAPWPAYVPAKVPKPDLPGDLKGIDPGYLTYPSDQLVQSVPEKVGRGETVTVMVNTYEAPPSPVSQNRMWQAINKALGVDIRLIVVPSANYQAKIATMMASNDLPDIVMMFNWIPRNADWCATVAADLTPYLSGDAVKAYPNLANFPTYTWQGVGLFGGRIMAVPIPRPRTGTPMICDRKSFDGAGAPVRGWTGAQYADALVHLTRGKHYGAGPFTAQEFGIKDVYSLWHGAPNIWDLKGGSLTKAEFTDEYRQAVEWAAGLRRKGVFYPDGLTTANAEMKTFFYNGTVRSYPDGFIGFDTAVTAVGEHFPVDMLRAPTGLGHGPASGFGTGTFGYTMVKKAKPERVKLMLRILDFFGAPFGSKEFELVNYGVEGEHFTRTANGDLKLTKLAQKENINSLPMRYITCGPMVSYYPGNPEAAKRRHAYQVDDVKIGRSNPVNGLNSPTHDRDGQVLDNLFLDTANAIVSGTKPMSAWDAVQKQWRKQGGTKMAEEYLKEHEAVHGR